MIKKTCMRSEQISLLSNSLAPVKAALKVQTDSRIDQGLSFNNKIKEISKKN
ncbi:MAG: hypothetical protein LBC45_03095 [Chlamydiales bacterium]|jgi:hypothetical protein|nr:hypothetical protein [Chlamydiales bacterium]